MIEYKALAFEVIECCDCHVQFCVTQEHNRELIESKKSFFCPNGHEQSYTGKSNKQIVRELRQNINTCKIRRDELLSELEQKEKSIKAYKMLYCREKKKAQRSI